MTQFKNLKQGSVLSETSYYKVVKVKGDEVQLRTDSGQDVILDKQYVESLLISADQYDSEKTISKTEAAQLFLSHPGIVLTVNYNKKVDEKAVKDSLYDLYPNKGGKILSEADFKKKVNAALKGVTEGEARTMIGRHFGELNDLGRVNFIDMEVEKDTSKTYDNRQRQVDPRTINYLIIKGVKYNVK